jgi:hypothetical protein
VRSYQEHPWGTHWELEGNMLGTKEKWKSPATNHPKLRREKNQCTSSACWAFPLAAWNFYFQNCLSPFLAWANTPIINRGYLFSHLPVQNYSSTSLNLAADFSSSQESVWLRFDK